MEEEDGLNPVFYFFQKALQNIWKVVLKPQNSDFFWVFFFWQKQNNPPQNALYMSGTAEMQTGKSSLLLHYISDSCLWVYEVYYQQKPINPFFQVMFYILLILTRSSLKSSLSALCLSKSPWSHFQYVIKQIHHCVTAEFST